jgi:uncharacterized protein YsxB (DUF464 family)
MVKEMITIKPNPNYSTGFIVEGHANHSPKGSDIVCASVSTATYMVATEISHRTHTEDGRMEANYMPTTYNKQIVNMLLRTLNELQQQYPEYVEVIE